MYHRTLSSISALAALALLGCGQQSAAPLALTEYTLEQAADSIPLPYRTDVRVGEVWMSLTDVPTDSRCPRGVVCVWAGDAVASIVVHPGCYRAGCLAPSALLALHTTLEPRAGEALGYRVQLVAVLPGPVAGTPTVPAHYVAWVRVSK